MIPLIILIFILITVVGIILLRSSTNENRPFVLLPAGMIWGVSVYIFLLNLNSKFLPGQSGIILSTVCLVFLGLITYIITYTKKVKLEIPNLISLIILTGLILTTIYFSRLKMTSIFPVADSDMQWAFAASFARGNYPIKTPWQPDLNPTYHLGAYFLEGSLLALSKLPLITLHALLNTYFLIAGSLFAIFIFWEIKYSFKNLWLLISALILYISFGVIIVAFPTPNLLEGIYKNIQELPSKAGAGAALVDLNSLSYLPARSLSLGLAFLAFYFSFVSFKNSKLKILSITLLLSVTALVEESMFLPLFGTVITVFILSFFSFIPNLNYLKSQRKNLFFILLFTSVMVILQGGLITELLSRNSSNFHMTLPFLDSSFTSKLLLLKNYSSNTDQKNIIFSASPLFFILIMLVYSFFKKNRNLGFLGLYSLISFLCFLLIEYRYYPANNIRFYNFGIIGSGLGLIYFLFYFLRARSLLQNILAFAMVGIFILLPSIIPELINQSNQINEARLKNYRSQILINLNPNTPFERISSWASSNLPINSRLISQDTDFPNPRRSVQFQYKGLYTTLGPQYIRVLRQEPGPEFFDLALSLNPSILKQTKTEYVYIESESAEYKQLPQFRKEDLSNQNYFEILQSIDVKGSKGEDIFYRLYKANPEFLDSSMGGKEITGGTLTILQKLIPENVSIYIADYGDPPEMSFWYRMAIIFALKDKDIRRNLTQTDYMAIETNILYKNGGGDEKYDYYILGPDKKPPYPSKLIWSNILATAWKR